MAKINPLVSSFSGEVGPRMLGNVEFQDYPYSCETAENLINLPQGPVTRRAGTRFIKEVRDSSQPTYLVPFEYSEDEAYQIEAGTNYFRFYKDQSNLIVQETDAAIINGTFDAGLGSWTDQSGAGSNYWYDTTNLRMLLISNGTTNAHAEQSVAVGASYQANTHVISFRVTGVAGDYVTFQVGTTTTASDVVKSDYGVGYHTVSFVPGSATIFVQFINSRAKSVGIDDVVILSNTPLELVTPYTNTQVFGSDRPQANDVMYFFVGGTARPYKLLRFGDNDWSMEEVEFLDGPYLDQNVPNVLLANSTVGLGQKRSTAPGSNTTLSLSATTGLGVTLTASSVDGINDGQGFLDTDVGRLIRIQHGGAGEAGYGIITARITSTVAFLDIRRDFTAITADDNWWIGAFSDTTGYPSTGVFHNQRLWVGSTTLSPYSIMASQSADIENMRPDSLVSGNLTVEDDDALNLTLASTKSNRIKWIRSGSKLQIGTVGAEWMVSPSTNGSVITPTDVRAEKQSTLGSASVRPVQAGDATIFVQKSSRKVYDFGYDFQKDGLTSRELTVISHRVGDSGIIKMDYAQEPNSSVYAVRNDGVLGVMLYRPEESKVAWSRIKVGGLFGSSKAIVEDVSVIPGKDGEGRVLDSGDRDEVWVMVKRTINGATKRYIEVFEGIFEGPIRHDYDTDALWESQMLADQKDAVYLDSALTYSGAATTTITGLSHLEGQTVKILTDGGIHPEKTVSSGSITLDYEATKVQVGLGYFHKYKSLKLNYGAKAGTAVGKIKRINRITFVLLDTASFKFGSTESSLTDVEFREVDDLMDTAVPLYTGEKKKDFSGGYSTDARIYVQSDNPVPFTMLAIAPEMKTNDVR